MCCEQPTRAPDSTFTASTYDPRQEIRSDLVRLINNGMTIVTVKHGDNQILTGRPFCSSIVVGGAGLAIYHEDGTRVEGLGPRCFGLSQNEAIQDLWNEFQDKFIERDGTISLQFTFRNTFSSPITQGQTVALEFDSLWNNSPLFPNDLSGIWRVVRHDQRFIKISHTIGCMRITNDTYALMYGIEMFR